TDSQLTPAPAFAAETVILNALSQVVGPPDEIVKRNDANSGMTSARTLSGAVSACLFDRAHFREAGGSPLAPRNPFAAIDPREIREASKESRAKRVMGGIANATRVACDPNDGRCSHFTTSRKLGEVLPAADLL